MLIMTVSNNDRLEFRFGQTGEVHRVRCKLLDKGRMQLLAVEARSHLYKQLALLKDGAFCDVWPGVRLRYYQNQKGIWKTAFNLDPSVEVERYPGFSEAA